MTKCTDWSNKKRSYRKETKKRERKELQDEKNSGDNDKKMHWGKKNKMEDWTRGEGDTQLCVFIFLIHNLKSFSRGDAPSSQRGRLLYNTVSALLLCPRLMIPTPTPLS